MLDTARLNAQKDRAIASLRQAEEKRFNKEHLGWGTIFVGSNLKPECLTARNDHANQSWKPERLPLKYLTAKKQSTMAMLEGQRKVNVIYRDLQLR